MLEEASDLRRRGSTTEDIEGLVVAVLRRGRLVEAKILLRRLGTIAELVVRE